MEEYLKRLQINLGNPQVQLAETKHIEIGLSVQLTRLKNSMVKDGHMNTAFLKQWVNGAAFHIQMLVHQARLERTNGSRAFQAAGVYQQQLNLLLEKYKRYLGTVVYVRTGYDRVSFYCCLHYTETYSTQLKCTRHMCKDMFTDSELIEVMFSKPPISWAKSYFSDLQTNIPALVRQHSTFHIHT